MRKNTVFQTIMMIVLIMATTLLIKIPLPTRGYFNFGDVAVVFAGLTLGAPIKKNGLRIDNDHGIWLAFLAGGIGSALADVIGGFAIFAPMTFIAKALECAWAALASTTKGMFHFLALVLGGAFMVLTYYAFESLTPSIGLQGSFSEIIPNLIQAAGGFLGGKIIFIASRQLLTKEK
ncbi:MAG: ECF transporter S component [Candidatus Cloacimonetes bacterium]|nr:ECF transporter S component [Candidatus Cloacimonadota bacterium]